MKSLQVGMMLILFLVLAMPAQAQLFFSRKPKIDPNQRVPELIVIVKTDADERKRAHAAEELRDYDPAVFSEIVPVLADVLLNDKKASVRTEALTSLTRIRPVSTQAGRAIEKAAADDDSVRIRLQAKAALPKYHLAGYSSKSSPAPSEKKGPSGKQTQEPPLADPKIAPPIPAPAPSRVVPPPAPLPIPAPLPTKVVPAPMQIPIPTPTPSKVVPPAAPIPIPIPTPPQAEAPSDRPIPRPFPPISVPPAKTPPPAEGPSLFP